MLTEHDEPIDWHAITVQRTADVLGTDTASGLTKMEVVQRLHRHGRNQLPESPSVSALTLFVDQWKNAMTLLLLVAGFIAFFIGDALESAAIGIVLVINALLGFINEYRAERAVAALRALVVPQARVVRERMSSVIPAAEVVPGDILILEAGDRVPADGRLIEEWALRVDESILTGESVPVDKDSAASLSPGIPIAERTTMVFTGTTVVQGRGRAIVTGTGTMSEIGKITRLIETAEGGRTPLQLRMDALGRFLPIAAVAIAVVMAVAGVARGAALLPMLETGIALAIAAVPEGLPAVLTITLALGMRRMAQRNALIRRLAAVETLGSANVICTDKTGTLTKNEMTVLAIQLGRRAITVSGSGYAPTGSFSSENGQLSPADDPHLLLTLRAMLLCNNAELRENAAGWEIVGDPTEGALVVAAEKAGLRKTIEQEQYPRIAEVPFDERVRKMATIHADPGGGEMTFVKGAPESVIPSCTHRQEGEKILHLDDAGRHELLAMNTLLASRALRVLALAYRKGRLDDPFADLTFLGFVGMMDPPRPEARHAVQECLEAGIRVVMITGDQRPTAEAIAIELGILESTGTDDAVMDGLAIDTIDDATLVRRVAGVAVYARVSPEHKLRIVKAWQARDQIVAMTGDGVNDAPALATADIGIAMGQKGTDVARESADMVLADDNFATIVAAVEEGRVVYSNVKKFVHYLFSCNLSEVLTMFVAVAVNLPLPLFPLQILWLNMITDVFPALALAAEPASPTLMKEPPSADLQAGGLPKSLLTSIILEGVVMAVAALGAFIWALDASGDPVRATTVAFVTLSFTQLFHVFNSRTLDLSVFGSQFFANRALWASLVLSAVLVVISVYVPILQLVLDTSAPTLLEWEVIAVASLAPAILIEIGKTVTRARKNRSP